YRGELARRIILDMAEHGGLLTEDDLARFAPDHQEPIRVGYRGYEFVTNPPPGGGVMVAEMLRILERFDLVALGHNSPAYICTVVEAMKIATRDKDAYISDPRFVEPPLARLLSDAYADECAAAIQRGDKAVVPRLVTGDPRGTTHATCVDTDGMVVALTHSLGIPSGVIPPGTGFMLNGCMSVFDPRPGRAGSIAPGKRRFASMCPSIVFHNGAPVMTVGAPGGTWITLGVLQAVLNVLDWGMTMQEAVSAPRFVATSEIVDISNRIPHDVQCAVEARGYSVKRSPLGYAFAGVHGISMFDGTLEGGADPQRDGYAAGLA
ncbi:MAG: gamma-glutamyltransferase family protein, partial [Pseudomonadota bacterium]|nr:gamma-glutamyltransferase family protein [Pseudomonadota bacterium]